MARQASKGAVAQSMKPPEYRAAVKRLASIKGQKSKQSEISKAIDKIYNACEGINGVHKEAAKFFEKLRPLDDAEKARICTDINGLLAASGAPTNASDIVDQAEGKENSLRLVSDMEDGDFGDENQASDDASGDGSEDSQSCAASDDAQGDDVGADDGGSQSEDGTSGNDAVEDVGSGASSSGDDDFEEASADELAQQTPRQEAVAEREQGDDAASEQKPLHERMKAATDGAAEDNTDLME